MTWVALSGDGSAWLCPDTFDGARRDALMPRGSLMIETRMPNCVGAQILLAHRRRMPWRGGLSLTIAAAGALVMELRQGDDVIRSELAFQQDLQSESLRIVFNWDAPARWGQVSIEQPGSDRVSIAQTPPPFPLLLGDVQALTQGLCQRSGDVIFVAVSDAIQPIGPMPTLTAAVPIATPQGYRRAGDLHCGDTVLTRDDGIVPVLHRVDRVVPALGSFCPVRLRAPYFGLRRDIVVAPDQRLVIGGTDVEYMFGRETVLVPARSLVSGGVALAEPTSRFISYTQLLLPGHAALIAAGATLDSLYVGRLRRDRDRLAASLLATCPRNLMPEHHRTGVQVLRPFEAMTLAQARAA